MCSPLRSNIQGVSLTSDHRHRSDRGGRDEQKIIWEGGGLKCTPGELLAIYFSFDLFEKKNSSKSGLHFRPKFILAKL